MLLVNCTLFSQSIIRQSINSWGNTGYNDDYYLKQTAGQSSNTTVINGDNTKIRQGFQQPLISISHIANCTLCNLSLSPNPLSTQSTLKVPLNTISYNIRIFDMIGKLVWMRQNLTSEKITLDAKDFQPNAYTIIVKYKDGSICSIKLIVIK